MPGTSIPKEWEDQTISLGLHADYDKLLLLTKPTLLPNSGNRPSEIGHFLELGAGVNIIRSLGVPLRFLSSDMTSYAKSCSLLSRPFVPPTAKSVLLRIATFAHGRTFENYVGRHREACALLGATTEWKTKATYAASEVLRMAKKGIFNFANFLFTPD